jgi:hypothetical protein
MGHGYAGLPTSIGLAAAAAAAGCGSTSSSAPPVADDVTRAALVAASANVMIFYTAHATFVGAAPGVEGVKLARADRSSFCVETPKAHLAGPGDSPAPAPGPCP